MRHATLPFLLSALCASAPLAAQQPLTNVRVEEATWIQDVAQTRWEGGRPVIYLNPRLLERFDPAMRDFFIGHEYGHVAQGHRQLAAAGRVIDSAVVVSHQRQELEADCYAASRLARDNRQAAEAAVRLFTRMGPRRFDRLHPTGSQRAANLLGCLRAASDSAGTESETWASSSAIAAPTVVLARTTWSLMLGHVRVLIDGRSMGTLSTIAHAPPLALRDLAEGPHRYELRLELFAYDELLQPKPVG
jgi:Zn-dependent protease with chaperone function